MSCEDKATPGPRPKYLPKGPWKIRRFALDESLILRMISGESLIIEHVALPQDATVLGSFQNGTATEVYVQSETYDLCTCLCRLPTKRINYSTGG